MGQSETLNAVKENRKMGQSEMLNAVKENRKMEQSETLNAVKENRKMEQLEMLHALEYMRKDTAYKNRKGIAFIGASVVIWLVILCIHLQDIPVEVKNLYTWFSSALLMPVAYWITRSLGIKLKNEDNPLNNVGMLFTMNQVLYLNIVCWVYTAVPEKMLMVFAMVFGAHLLPFGWLYQSRSYTIASIVITISALIIGCSAPSWLLAAFMLAFEVIFVVCLWAENCKVKVVSC